MNPRQFLAAIALLAGWMALSSLIGAAADNRPADSSLYLKVQLNRQIKASALKPGDVIEGKLLRDVYSGDRQLFPGGSSIRVTVDKLERRRRVPNDHWPWVVKFFTPRHEKCPTFQTASVFLPTGAEIPLNVSLIYIGREVQVHASGKKAARAPSGEANAAPAGQPAPVDRKSGPIVTLEATEVHSERYSAPASLTDAVTVASGTEAKIILLGGVSASKSHLGDSFQARLVEPVRVGSAVVLPEGSMLEGEVVRSQPPRWLSRAGSLDLKFRRVILPGGRNDPIEASITSAEVDKSSHMRIDEEGTLHGERPGKAWVLLNAGVAGGLAKAFDDGTQLAVEAIISTATDASTAGTARIAATCASAIFMLTRHGRDVVLPKFTEMEIVFDRPTAISKKSADHE